MRAPLIRKWLSLIRLWPLHPQWLLAISGEDRSLQAALSGLRGNVLDVGCSNRRLASRIPENCRYIGLDYPHTAVSLYNARPDVFADAAAIPFQDRSMQGVILKDVLEHVRNPEATLTEVSRVLDQDGKLLLWIPFSYPIHDAPYDFQRYTEYGLRRDLAIRGLCIVELSAVLAPIETASLNVCLALADAAEQIVTRRAWLLPVVPILALLVLMTNLVGKSLSWLPATRFMPAAYRILAVRNRDAAGGDI